MAQIKLRIFTKFFDTKDGRTLPSYETRMNLPYIDKDGTNHGIKNRSVQLKFKQDYAPTKKQEKMFGILIVDSADIDFPSKWQVKVAKDGTSKYPTVWVKGEWTYEEVRKQATQDMFSSEEPKSEEPKSEEPTAEEKSEEIEIGNEE